MSKTTNNAPAGILQASNREIVKWSGKLIEYGLPLLYFLISVAFYLRTYDSAQIKITLIQLGGTALVAAWLIKLAEEHNWSFFKENSLIIVPLVLFMFSGIGSYLHSPFVYASANELVRRVFYIFMSLIVIKEFNSEKKLNTLVGWLIAAAFVSTVYGVIQYLDYRFFPPAPEPGLDPFIWRGAFAARIFSTFGNPNFFGDFLVVMSPIVLALYAKNRSFHLLILWLLIAFCTIATVSKGAWLGFGAGLLVFMFLYIGFFIHVQKEKIRKVLVILGIVTVLVVGGGIFKNLKGRTDSASFRIFTWISTWEMINTQPWIGTGLGTFYVTYPAWRRPQIFFIEGRHNTETDHPENEYLEVWYDEGLIGMGLFLLILTLFSAMGLKNLKAFSAVKTDTQKPGIHAYYQLGVLTALIAQLVHNLVCVSLRFVSSGIFLWLLIGLIGAMNIHYKSQKQEESDEENGFTSFFSVLLAVAGIYLLIRASFQLPEHIYSRVLKGGGIAAGGLLCFGAARFFIARGKGIADTRFLKRSVQLGILVASVFYFRLFYGYFDADVNHNLAIFYSKQAQWTSALDHYNKVVKENPSFIMSHYFMGNVFNDRWGIGDAERSINKYQDVWKLAPNYVQSHHQAGLIFLKWGEDEKRKADEARTAGDLKTAKEHEAKKLELWNKALYEFERYRAIDPIFPLNYTRIAWIYMQLGQQDKAEETYKAHLEFPDKLRKPPHNAWDENWAPRRAKEYAETCLNLGNMRFMKNDLVEAEKYYKRAIEFDPVAVNAMKNLAILYGRQNRVDLASELWKKLRGIAPNDPDVQRVFQPPQQTN